MFQAKIIFKNISIAYFMQGEFDAEVNAMKL